MLVFDWENIQFPMRGITTTEIEDAFCDTNQFRFYVGGYDKSYIERIICLGRTLVTPHERYILIDLTARFKFKWQTRNLPPTGIEIKVNYARLMTENERHFYLRSCDSYEQFRRVVDRDN